MNISAARAEHAPAIAEIWNGMIRDTLATFTSEPKSDAQIATLIESRPEAFWIMQTDQIEGFVTFGPFRAGPGYAATVEHTIVLRHGALGRGIGTALMQTAEQGAVAQGAHVMVAAISSANPAAVAFHSKRGFVQTANMPQVGRKAGRWLDLILMQKTVSPR